MHDEKHSVFSNKTPNLVILSWKLKKVHSFRGYSACIIHAWHFFASAILIKNINVETGSLILWGDQFMQLKSSE